MITSNRDNNVIYVFFNLGSVYADRSFFVKVRCVRFQCAERNIAPFPIIAWLVRMSVQPQVSTHLKRMAVLHNSTATDNETFYCQHETLHEFLHYEDLCDRHDGRIVFYCRLVSDKRQSVVPYQYQHFQQFLFDRWTDIILYSFRIFG